MPAWHVGSECQKDLSNHYRAACPTADNAASTAASAPDKVYCSDQPQTFCQAAVILQLIKLGPPAEDGFSCYKLFGAAGILICKLQHLLMALAVLASGRLFSPAG